MDSSTIQKPDVMSGFECHPNTGPFYDQTHINFLNTGLVRYSDGYCISELNKVPYSNVSVIRMACIQIPTVLSFLFKCSKVLIEVQN